MATTDQTKDLTGETQFVFVSCYNNLTNLAHQPKGTPAKFGMYVFRLDPMKGTMTLFSVCEDEECLNPAFIRYHPKLQMVYACTEDINQNGKILCYAVSPSTGKLRKVSSVSAGGKSTCYISMAYDLRHILVANYWDSTIASIPIEDTGEPRPLKHLTQVPGKNAGARNAAKKHGDDPHSKHRLAETHAHAIYLDPSWGRIAYVPDLGEDVVKQFVFDQETATLKPAGQIPADRLSRDPAGPRYIEFHPKLNVAYVVNELGSSISVFEFDESKAATLTGGETGDDAHTLVQIQSIEVVPTAFPRKLNTCGRLAISPDGKYVLVSNRGHDSIAVLKIQLQANMGAAGRLTIVGHTHTGGATPRHFKFDQTGRWVLAANQDSDTIAMFAFDPEDGSLTPGNQYSVPSPNFVDCRCPHPRRLADGWIYAKL